MKLKSLAFNVFASFVAAAPQFAEKPAFTVNRYKDASLLPLWRDNYFLSISQEPTSVEEGSERLSLSMPKAEIHQVWELIGYYDAKKAGNYTFEMSGTRKAAMQMGFSDKESKLFYESLDLVVSEITYKNETYVLKKGPNPIRVVFVTKSGITSVGDIKLFMTNDGIKTPVNENIMQAWYEPAEATVPEYRATGFIYRTFQEPETDIDSVRVLYEAYPKLNKIQEGYLDESFTGVIDKSAISPEVIEAIGFFQVPADGTYNVVAESGPMIALQIGHGSKTKDDQYRIDSGWNIMDTRVMRSVNFELEAGLHYPFRLVIVGSEKDPKMTINQFGPNNEPMDFLGIWDTVAPEASASNDKDVEEQTPEKKHKTIPLIHVADPGQSAAANRPQDEPASYGHVDNKKCPSLDDLPASLTEMSSSKSSSITSQDPLMEASKSPLGVIGEDASLPTDSAATSTKELASAGGQTPVTEEEKAHKPIDGAKVEDGMNASGSGSGSADQPMTSSTEKHDAVSKESASSSTGQAKEGASVSEEPKTQTQPNRVDQAESGPGLSEPKDELYGFNFSARVKAGYRCLSKLSSKVVFSNVKFEEAQKSQSDECKNTGSACLPQPAIGYQDIVDHKVTAVETPTFDGSTGDASRTLSPDAHQSGGHLDDALHVEEPTQLQVDSLVFEGSTDNAGPKKSNDNRVTGEEKEEEKVYDIPVETNSGASSSESMPTQVFDQKMPLESLEPGIKSVCNW